MPIFALVVAALEMGYRMTNVPNLSSSVLEEIIEQLDSMDRLDIQIGHLEPKVEELRRLKELRTISHGRVESLLHDMGCELRVADLIQMTMRIARRGQ